MELSELPYSMVRRKWFTTKPDLKSNNIEATFDSFESYTSTYCLYIIKIWMDLKIWQVTDTNLLPKNLHSVKRSGKTKVGIESLICSSLCLVSQGNRRVGGSARPALSIKESFLFTEKYKRLGTWDKSEKFKLSIRLSLEFRNIRSQQQNNGINARIQGVKVLWSDQENIDSCIWKSWERALYGY